MTDQKDLTNVIDGALARLETLLRYVAPGFVMLLALMLIDPQFPISVQNGTIPLWSAILFAALTGITLYSVHTGVILRLLVWCVIVKLLIKKSRWLEDRTKKASHVMFNLDTERWKRRASADREVSIIQQELDRWAAFVNFLYCSGYALIIARLIACVLHSANVNRYGVACLVVGALLLGSAFVSNYALTDRDLWAKREYPGGKPKTQG